jgi:hypothetical protein
MHGLDVEWLARLIVKRLSQLGHRHLQNAFADMCFRPHFVQQFLLGHQTAQMPR